MKSVRVLEEQGLSNAKQNLKSNNWNKQIWNNGEESVSTQQDYSSLIQFNKINDQLNAEQNTHIINEMHIIASIY